MGWNGFFLLPFVTDILKEVTYRAMNYFHFFQHLFAKREQRSTCVIFGTKGEPPPPEDFSIISGITHPFPNDSFHTHPSWTPLKM